MTFPNCLHCLIRVELVKGKSSQTAISRTFQYSICKWANDSFGYCLQITAIFFRSKFSMVVCLLMTTRVTPATDSYAQEMKLMKLLLSWLLNFPEWRNVVTLGINVRQQFCSYIRMEQKSTSQSLKTLKKWTQNGLPDLAILLGWPRLQNAWIGLYLRLLVPYLYKPISLEVSGLSLWSKLFTWGIGCSNAQ